MIKRLSAVGNSAALLIDKPILELLNITMETPLEITTDGTNLIISPVTDTAKRGKVIAALDRIKARHHKRFKKLAK